MFIGLSINMQNQLKDLVYYYLFKHPIGIQNIK